VTCRDNVMRYSGGFTATEAARKTYDAQDEAQGPGAEENLQQPYPAVIVGNRWMTPSVAVLENNRIEGWNNDVAVSVGSGSRPAPCRLLVRNNTVGGTILVSGTAKDFIDRVDGNLDAVTLQAARTERKEYPPAKAKK